MTIAVALDFLVIALLIPTITYCFLLNRRLDGLRAAQGEMHKLSNDFSRSIEQARAGIADLKAAQSSAGNALQANMDKAQSLIDELAIMTQSADRLAGRLDQAIGDRRRDVPTETLAHPRASGAGNAVATAAVATDTETALHSAAERELMQALRRMK